LRRRGVDHARPDLKQTTIGHLCGSELPYNRLRTKTGADGGTRSPIAGNPGKGKVISLFGLLGFLARRFDFSSFSSSAIRSFSSRAGSRADVAGYGVQLGLHVADKIVGGALFAAILSARAYNFAARFLSPLACVSGLGGYESPGHLHAHRPMTTCN